MHRLTHQFPRVDRIRVVHVEFLEEFLEEFREEIIEEVLEEFLEFLEKLLPAVNA